MYNYQVDEKEIEDLLKEELKQTSVTAPSSESELNKILKQIEKDNSWAQGEIGGYIKEELNLEKLDAGEFSEEEAKQQAENFYAEEIIKGKTNIEENAQNEANALEKQKTTITEENEKNRTALEQMVLGAKDEAKKDAINRGIARSSIIINKIEAFDEKMLSEFNRLNIEYSKAFAEIESNLNMLEVQKENALKNFDLTYAVKISGKIEELKNEYEKKKEEVAKYNNEIALKEAEFNAKEQERAQEYDSNIIKNNTAYLAAVEKYGKEAVDKQVYDAKFVYVEAYFKSLPRETAFKTLVSNDYWLKQIGQTNFIKLANELGKAV